MGPAGLMHMVPLLRQQGVVYRSSGACRLGISNGIRNTSWPFIECVIEIAVKNIGPVGNCIFENLIGSLILVKHSCFILNIIFRYKSMRNNRRFLVIDKGIYTYKNILRFFREQMPVSECLSQDKTFVF